MTAVYAAGAVVGLGLFLLAFALVPQRLSLSRQIAAYDAARPGAAVRRPLAGSESQVSRWLGAALARLCAEQGWEFRSLRSRLALVDRSFESYLASKVLLGLLGLLFAPLLLLVLTVSGLHLTVVVPVWAGLGLGTVFFLLPDVELKQQVEKRRRDFRHAIGAFLDLVSMNLAGGRGVPEALTAGASIGGGWPFARLRDTLAFARLQGLTPWAALGRLGDEVGINELRDLAAALALVADDGAKIRDSLAARAATLRRRELAEMEGRAGERSQSMLVAQMLIVLGYLLFLAYPAVIRIL